MKFILFSIFFISINTFADDASCLSHAQCQNIIEESTGCFLVEDDPESLNDEASCSVKCYDIQIGSFCDFKEGASYGTCRDENYKNSSKSITSKSCKGAIPLKVIKELYNL